MSAVVWTAFLANFVFWTGTAAGAVAFAALLDLTGAEWAGPLRATAARFRRFLPAAVVLFFLLLPGARSLYRWIDHPTGSSWLRLGPFIVRDAAALVAVAGAAAWFGRLPSVRSSVICLMAYAIGVSVLALDLMMSVAAPWGSTLFPAYVTTSSMYAGIAAAAMGAFWRADVLEAQRAADLRKLLLGFAMVWMYLVWSQYLVIWYGNLGDEVAYLQHVIHGRSRPLAWAVWAGRFLVPFVILLMPAAGRRAVVLPVASLIAVGFWAECFLIVGFDTATPWSLAIAAVVAVPFVMLFLFLTASAGRASPEAAPARHR